MDKKYIVTLADEYALVHKLTVPVTINGKHTAWMQTDINLTPYTEPDMEQVRKEAYKDGYDAACKDIDIKSKTNAAHRKGLEDAWEAARKFMSEVIDTRFRNNFMVEIFKCDNAMGAMKVYSASECIEKFRQYEREKDKHARIEYNCEEIKDVLNTTMKECNVSLDDIAEVLQKMKEA